MTKKEKFNVRSMDLATFFSLAGAAFIFGISPGPGTLAALSVSTTQGLRSGLIRPRLRLGIKPGRSGLRVALFMPRRFI